ncbi:MAG: acetyl-CoA C-acyltransferase [Acidobacteria bacterium]|nr:MAG: acetyl-CoA C-acyltransferase [Acidobacteriota bacterium]
MKSVFIASAVRTAIGKFGGALAPLSAVELGVIAVKEALSRAEVQPARVNEVIIGHARGAGNGPNPARQVSYRSGIPQEISAYTVNKACGSGLKAIILGCQEILLGNADVIVAGGMESMSNVPYLVEQARWGLRMGNHHFIDGMYRDGFYCPLSELVMGETAENLASLYKITREEQDQYALRSQQKAAAATRAKRFGDELIPVAVRGKKGETKQLDSDEHIRMDASLDDMAKLSPVFVKTGTITAGNSSGITDGASATVLASEDEAKRRNLKPLARIIDWGVAGVDPKIMGIGPVPAVKKLLAKTGMNLEQFEVVEINEAFASQVLACLRELPIDPARINVNGGAIALGHPIGCTGSRIVTTLVHEMRKRKARYGLATLCISGGMGIALAIERL